jgi:NTP pyrophosphatase (non-canonical NTP hydrolase)
MSYEQFVRSKRKPADKISMTNKQKDLVHFGILAVEEAGEVLGLIKKHVIYGKELDLTDVQLELGDLEFALEALRQTLYLDRDTILAMNQAKLNLRYKEGYSDEEALQRHDLTEGV